MPSPIKQAELQLALLKQITLCHDSQFLGTLLGMQQGFGGRCFDVFCAIFSDASIDRSIAPVDVADKLVKSEFVVEALDKNKDFKTFFQFKARLAENRPSFTAQELTKICDFILAHTSQPCSPRVENKVVQQRRVANNVIAKEAISETDQVSEWVSHELKPDEILPDTKLAQVAHIKGQHHSVTVTCKHCGAADGLTAQSGRYGYFVQCGNCGGNTPLKRPCPVCKSQNTKVSKSQSVFTLGCQACSASMGVFN